MHVGKGSRGEAVKGQQPRSDARHLAGTLRQAGAGSCGASALCKAALFHHPLTLKDLFKAYGEIKSFATI